MVDKRIIDLKYAGVLQDLKETQRTSGGASTVRGIKSQGRKKLERIEAPYKASAKETRRVMSIPEKQTFTTKEEVNAYKKQLYDAQYEQNRLSRRQKIDNIRKGLSRADTASSVALERFGSIAKKAGSQRIISRSVMKKGQMTVTDPQRDYVQPSILGQQDIFFRGELNKEKRSLFFS